MLIYVLTAKRHARLEEERERAQAAQEQQLSLPLADQNGVPLAAHTTKRAAVLRRIAGTWRAPLQKGEKTLLMLLIPFMLFALICLLNHTIYEYDGAYWTGQCTYGDMNFHMGIMTSIAEQGTFPPEYSIFPGAKLDYYFLCDSVSSSLYLFGSGLRLAYILPMLAGFALVFSGFWFLAERVLKKHTKAAMAFTLFFMNGGFGLIYFLDNLKNNPENFSRIFTAYYETPTNYVNQGDRMTNVRWTNTVVDMMLPQRATLFGWMILFLVLYLLYLAVFEGHGHLFLPAGIMGGLIPMIQTYAYFTLGLAAVCWLVYSCWRDRCSKKILFSWLKFGIPAVLLALPQFFLWIFSAVGGESFIRAAFNAYNESDNWLWFWVKNVGMVFILLVPAFLSASKRLKIFFSSGLFIFLVAEFIVFQTHSYDNNKLYLMWYAFACILTADFMVDCYAKLKGIRGRAVLAGIVVVLCTNAAVFTMAREMISGFRPYSYTLYSKELVACSEFIRENTEPDALFVTHNNHNNMVSTLTGRNIFVGAGTFLYSHDVDYTGREAMLKQIYTDSTAFEQYRKEYGFDYVLISAAERNSYKNIIDDYFREHYNVVYEQDQVVIFDVR